MKIKTNLIKGDYHYPIYTILRRDYDNIDIKRGNKIYVCGYRINKHNALRNIMKPFIEYMLYKFNDGKDKDKLTFPYKIYKTGKNIIEQGNKIINKIYDENIEREGYINYGDDIYIFYEINQKINEKKFYKKEDKIWWCLIDEICNHNKIITFDIMENVYKLFYNNNKLIYILDKENKEIEIPTVAYTGDNKKWLEYNVSLGRFRTLDRYGPYYYFGSFDEQTRYAGWLGNKKHEEGGGYVRYALFLGNMRQILYRETDIFHSYIKYLDTKKDIVKIEIKNPEKAKEALKLDKMNEGWPKLGYDSISTSYIKYKNVNAYFSKSRNIVLKSFEQQTPLTYHYLDFKTLNTFFNINNKKYSII